MINIVGLSVGLACCILILFFVKDELSYDRFHEKSKRIYQLVCDRTEKDGKDEKFAIASMVQGPAFKQEIPEIEEFVRVSPKQLTVKRGSEVFSENITWVDAGFLSVFSFPLIDGSPLLALRDLHSAVLTEGAARKYFGTTSALGRSLQIEINGHFEFFVVTAIAKEPPGNSSIQFRVLIPFKYLEEASPDNGWMWVSYPTYLLVKPAANVNVIASKMQRVYKERAHEEIDMNHAAGYDNTFVWNLIPFANMHLNTEYKGNFEASNPLYYRILTSIAFFILLMATINFINLTMANSLKRHKEIGIRKAIGSMRKQLVWQFLCESFLLTLLSFCVAILFAWAALPIFNELSGKKINFAYHFDATLILALLFLLLFTGFSAGLYPAYVLSSLNPVQALSKDGRNLSKNKLMKLFVIAQFFVSSFFMLMVYMMNEQFNFIENANLGYDEKNLIEFTIDKAILDKPMMDIFRSEFASLPGVQAAGFCNVGKFGGRTISNGAQFEAVYERVGVTYLNAIGAHILKGRGFSDDFRSDSASSVLVNEAFVHRAGWSDAIGKTVDYMNIPGWGDRKVFVVGVVKDYHAESLKEKIKPMIFTMDDRLPLGKFVVRLNPFAVSKTLAVVGQKYQLLVPDHPFQYAFREDINRSLYSKESRWKNMTAIGASLAIFISCIGLFGISLLTSQKRAKEIAIRKVLGASSLSILLLVGIDLIGLVWLGFLIASPISLIVLKIWQQDFAYRAAISWHVFAGAGIAMAFISAIAVVFHSVKASLVRPVSSLRQV